MQKNPVCQYLVPVLRNPWQKLNRLKKYRPKGMFVTWLKMLDSCTIIFVLILSYFVLKRRYTWIHLFFVVLVFVGLGLMIYSDIKKADDGFSAKWKGCLLVVIACVLYSISNVAVENLMATRQAARIEYLVSQNSLIFSI